MATTTATTQTTTQPLVIHEVTRSAYGSRRVSPDYELRATTLTAAAYLMGMPLANFDAVRGAAAMADLERCPVCRDHPPRRPPAA